MKITLNGEVIDTITDFTFTSGTNTLSLTGKFPGQPEEPVQPEEPAGLVEIFSNPATRRRMTASEMRALIPGRGAFRFPAPYNTLAARITNETDCNGDGVFHVGYSFWQRMNNHVGQPHMLVAVGVNREMGGGGMTLFRVDKATMDVEKFGPIFSPEDGNSYNNGEGFYFSHRQATKMYMPLGSRLVRRDVLTGEQETVFDVANLLPTGKRYMVWHATSSDDDNVHCCIVKEIIGERYPSRGALVYTESTKTWQFFDAAQYPGFDEPSIDRSGKWMLVVTEDDDYVIKLSDRSQRVMTKFTGQVGHRAMGYECVVGADKWGNKPSHYKFYDFTRPLDQTGETVFYGSDWNVFAPAHVSWENCVEGRSRSQELIFGSSINAINKDYANEIIAFRPDASGKVLVIAPNLSSVEGSGGGDNYSKQPKGMVDVTGQFFMWAGNCGGDRLDVFVVKVPRFHEKKGVE